MKNLASIVKELNLRETGSDEEESDTESVSDDDGEVADPGPRDKVPPESNQTGLRTVFQDWPHDPATIQQIDAKGYMAKACEGVYLPLRHASDILEFGPCVSECYLSANRPFTDDELTSKMNVLWTKGWTMGAIAFDGLDVKSTLAIKVITALEFTPKPDSMMAKLAEEAPPMDKLAQVQCRAAMAQLPSAFPASANALGTIMDWVTSALSSAGVPIASQLAMGYKAANSAVGGKMSAFLDSIF